MEVQEPSDVHPEEASGPSTGPGTMSVPAGQENAIYVLPCFKGK